LKTHLAPARLLGLGTAVPPHRLRQDVFKAMCDRVLGASHPEFKQLSRTFDTSGINARYSVVPIEWFEEPKDSTARNTAYLEGATPLFVAAATQALAASGLQVEDVDTVVTVSSTGTAMPSLDARAMKLMSFRKDVRRLPIFGLGCAGGVTGLAIASQLAAASPGNNVLLVCVDACTLSFRWDPRKTDIVTNALFGDGAAAACVTAGSDVGPIFGIGQEYTWSDTLRMMGWDVESNGFRVVLDPLIVQFVKQNFVEAMETGLKGMRICFDSLARMIFHPGSVKVVDAIEKALHIEQGGLDHEREVLREFSNMAAPTVLFVLERFAKTAPHGDMMMAALGPGFTASMLPIRFE
jgi:alkylresorcinol/alkylpyrone synthase